VTVSSMAPKAAIWDFGMLILVGGCVAEKIGYEIAMLLEGSQDHIYQLHLNLRDGRVYTAYLRF
jgi:hypothetical protein